jgi:hypothetical protein
MGSSGLHPAAKTRYMSASGDIPVMMETSLLGGVRLFIGESPTTARSTFNENVFTVIDIQKEGGKG